MESYKSKLPRLYEEIMSNTGIVGYNSEKQIGVFTFPMSKDDVTGVIEIKFEEKKQALSVITGVNYAKIKDIISNELSHLKKWKAWSPNVAIDLGHELKKEYLMTGMTKESLCEEVARDIRQTGIPFMELMCDRQEAISFLLKHRDYYWQDMQIIYLCYHWNKDAETGFRIIEEDVQYWKSKIKVYYQEQGVSLPEGFEVTKQMLTHPHVGRYAINHNQIKSYKSILQNNVWTVPPAFYEHERPSARVKIGNIYCFHRKDHKRFFQYIGNDTCNLNGQTSRMFKRHYPLDFNDNIDTILNDDVEFHFQTFIKIWEKMGFWTFVGNSPQIGDTSNIVFRDSAMNSYWRFQGNIIENVEPDDIVSEGGIGPAGMVRDTMDSYDY